MVRALELISISLEAVPFSSFIRECCHANAPEKRRARAARTLAATIDLFRLKKSTVPFCKSEDFFNWR